jgi:hypothetical protein
MMFSKAHEKVLRKFIYCEVDFVLVGGHAAIFHGVQRTTSDMDILVRPTAKNGTRILEAFTLLGLVAEDLTPEDFTVPQFFNFGIKPGTVDILNFMVGLSLEEVFANSLYVKIDELRLKVIDIRDLLTNKKSIQRNTEKADVDNQDIKALIRIIEWKEKGKRNL